MVKLRQMHSINCQLSSYPEVFIKYFLNVTKSPFKVNYFIAKHYSPPVSLTTWLWFHTLNKNDGLWKIQRKEQICSDSGVILLFWQDSWASTVTQQRWMCPVRTALSCTNHSQLQSLRIWCLSDVLRPLILIHAHIIQICSHYMGWKKYGLFLWIQNRFSIT